MPIFIHPHLYTVVKSRDDVVSRWWRIIVRYDNHVETWFGDTIRAPVIFRIQTRQMAKLSSFLVLPPPYLEGLLIETDPLPLVTAA